MKALGIYDLFTEPKWVKEGRRGLVVVISHNALH
jgi:hypothetical protein